MNVFSLIIPLFHPEREREIERNRERCGGLRDEERRVQELDDLHSRC